MIIHVGKINPDGERFVGEEPPGCLQMEQEEDVQPASPVRYDLTAFIVSRKILVTGRVSMDLRFRCSRCAEMFPATVSDDLTDCVADYVDANQVVDLTEDIREAIILAFPNYPLCSPACKGLCAQCGANLNAGPCKCAHPPADVRWNALDRLKPS